MKDREYWDDAKLDEWGRQYYPNLVGKTVPAHMLIAWLYEHHEHPDDFNTVVDSMEMDRWIRRYVKNQKVKKK